MELDNENKNTELSNTEDSSREEVLKDFDEGLNALIEDKSEEVKESSNEELEEVEDSEDETTDETSDDKEEFDNSKEEEQEDESEEPAGSKEEVDIPVEQVDIARKMGFTDEQIVDFAENHPTILTNMVDNFNKKERITEAKPEVVEPIVKRESKEVPLVEHVKVDTADMDSDMAKVVDVMLTAHNSLIDKHNDLLKKSGRIDEITKILESNEVNSFNVRVDTAFDSLAEHLPEVGLSSDLTPDNSNLRLEIFALANALSKTRGITLEKGIDEAAYMWKTSQLDVDELEKKATTTLKRKLNKNKTRMTARPGGKKTVKRVSPREDAEQTLKDGMDKLME